jgi:hypothetical protein
MVESAVVVGAFCQRAFQRLEPIAGKLARWVLRGENGSNVILLPDNLLSID